jgi:3-oxoacyl-[acyl-carrier-protein] synthase-1
MGLVMLVVLKTACEKKYVKGNRILMHLGNEDGSRSSLIFARLTDGQ